MIHHAARITDIVEENYRVKTFTLDLALPTARPGQFAMVWLPNVNERPLSLWMAARCASRLPA